MKKLLDKLRRYDTVSADEERALRGAMSEVATFGPGQLIVSEKTELVNSNLLLEGFGYRYKDLEGGARQILQLGLPGDFLDLHSLALKQLDHEIGSVTHCKLAIFPHERLIALTEDHPHLGRSGFRRWLMPRFTASGWSRSVCAPAHRGWLTCFASFRCD